MIDQRGEQSFQKTHRSDIEFCGSCRDEYAPLTPKATKKQNTVKDPMDLCQICKEVEPHGSTKTIQWVQYAMGCGKWYQKNCLSVIYRHMPVCLINYKCPECEKDSRSHMAAQKTFSGLNVPWGVVNGTTRTVCQSFSDTCQIV